MDIWHQKLNAIAAVCGFESLPDLKAAFPIRGGQTVILKIREDAIVKVYAKDLQVQL